MFFGLDSVWSGLRLVNYYMPFMGVFINFYEVWLCKWKHWSV